MRLQCTVHIQAPPETVFACVDEPDKIVGWVEGAVEHAYTSERQAPTPVGQRFHQRLQQGKSIREFAGEIIAWEQPHHFGLRIPSAAYTSEAHFRMTPRDACQSQLHYRLDVTLHTPLAKVLGLLLRVPLGFFVRKQMRRLKAYAEQVYAEPPAPVTPRAPHEPSPGRRADDAEHA